MNDVLIKGLLNEEAAVYACDVSEMAECARVTHGTSPAGTIILGRTIAATTMLCATLKNPTDKLTLMINGGGPSGTVMAVGNAGLRIKAYMGNPAVESLPSDKGGFDISGAVGSKGNITIARDTGLKEPYTGMVPLVSGEIGEDVAQYLLTSEQQPSIVYVNTWLETDMSVVDAGGIIIRPLPGCGEQTLNEIEDRISKVRNYALYLLQDGVKGSLARIFSGMHLKILEALTPVYECDCGRERLYKVLASLGENEIRDMIENDKGATITCHFCNKVYEFDESELEELIRHAGKRSKEI